MRLFVDGLRCGCQPLKKERACKQTRCCCVCIRKSENSAHGCQNPGSHRVRQHTRTPRSQCTHTKVTARTPRSQHIRTPRPQHTCTPRSQRTRTPRSQRTRTPRSQRTRTPRAQHTHTKVTAHTHQGHSAPHWVSPMVRYGVMRCAYCKCVYTDTPTHSAPP